MTEEQADRMLKLLIEISDKLDAIDAAVTSNTLVFDAIVFDAIKDLSAVVEEKLG